MQRATKIIATLGPASERPEVLRDMIRAGLNVVRLNFSHGTVADHRARYDLVRQISKEVGQDRQADRCGRSAAGPVVG